MESEDRQIKRLSEEDSKKKDRKWGRYIKRFKCGSCSYSAASKSHIKRHETAVHEKIKDNTCELCGHAFTQWWSENAHEERSHGNQEI